MAQWDEDDLQVNSLITLWLSSNLRTHLGTTSEATWASLDQTFGVLHFTATYKDYEFTHSIKLVVGENPQVQIQKIWTILECLQVNRCIISNYLQGMLLLKAIPKGWDRIAQIYCHGMVQANITFNGVQDTIMNEYEWIAHPAQLAHIMDKISAVKHKGQSPKFSEQKHYSAPKEAPDSAPSRLSRPPKQKCQGGQREKARQAHIVSSAFVPVAVLNCMQESHHASTSHIKEVPVEPTPAPGYTMVGGPSCTPVRSAAPVQVATFKPTGISYAKVTSLPMQSKSGLSSKQAPFNMDKERQLLKKAGIQPTAEPLRTAHKALEVDDNLEEMKAVLSKHKRFCEFASASPIVQNAVASSSSSAPPPQPKLSFEDCFKTPTPQDYKDTEEREKC